MINGDGASAMMSDHIPPQNLEAERSVIASAILDNSLIDDLCNAVTIGDFYREAHVVLWGAIVEMRDGGKPVDSVSLMEYMTRRGTYRAIGGDETLLEICQSIPHTANALYHAGIVHQKAQTRNMIQAATEIIREGYSGMHTAQEFVDIAERKIFAIADREATGDTIAAPELIGTTMTAILSREQGQARGLMTGFEDIDFLTDGFKPQDFIIVAARPSMGKTAFAIAVAFRAAVDGHSVFFASLEMSKESVGERILSSAGNVEADRLKRPWTLSQADRERMTKVGERMSETHFKIDDRPSRTVSQIAANARRIKARDGLGLVVIDYLSLIDGQRQKGENRQEEVARMSRRLKSMARELDCPVMCLHQLNRQAENRDGHRPRLSDLRESGQIEQDADQVLLLHRPEYYDPNDQPGIAEVIVAKNRNGPTGAARLAFYRHCTRFQSIDATASY